MFTQALRLLSRSILQAEAELQRPDMALSERTKVQERIVAMEAELTALHTIEESVKLSIKNQFKPTA